VNTTLITGASSGLGLHLAHRFAEKGHNLILVARSLDKLSMLKKQILQNHSVNIELIALDLTQDGATEELTKKIPYVATLINCAGRGNFGLTEQIPINEHIATIKLNCEIPVKLCTHYSKEMKAKKSGTIINIVSLGGYHPLPFFNVYSASKSFLLTFTEGLAYELKEYNVQVINLSPGGILTDFHLKSGLPPAIAEKYEKLMQTPEQVADELFNCLRCKKSSWVTGRLNRIYAIVQKLLPRRWVTASAGKFYKDFMPKN